MWFSDGEQYCIEWWVCDGRDVAAMSMSLRLLLAWRALVQIYASSPATGNVSYDKKGAA